MTTTGGSGLQLYGHAALDTQPIEVNLKNNSKFIAGTVSDVNGFTVTGGSDSWIGWTNTENGMINVNIDSGSEMVLGSTVIGRNDSHKQAVANYGFNISGTKDAVSKLLVRNLNLQTSSNTAATKTSYNTYVNVGEYSLLSANNINIASLSGAVNGTAKISVASNSQILAYSNSRLSDDGETIFNGGGSINIGAGSRSDGDAILEAKGSSIRIESSVFFIGNDDSSGGTNILSIKNTSTDTSKQNFISAYEFTLKNGFYEGLNQTNRMILDGNIYISGRTSPDNGDTSFRFNVATNESVSGTSELIFRGNNLQFGYFFQLNAGHQSSKGGQGIVSIETSNNGSAFYIYKNMNILGGEGTSADAPIGGVLRMVADEAGFAYINANAINFTGVLELDFRKLLGKFEEGTTFKLINARNANDSASWLTFCENLAAGEFANLNLVLRDETDEVYFELNGNELSVFYTSYIPEPSTYAMIFGALVLALVAYRKRK